MIQWRPRWPPLVPRAVAAAGDAAITLAKRASRLPPEARSALQGVARLPKKGDEVLLPASKNTALIILLAATGEPDVLPWVDGAIYLGREPEAPALLLPTNRAPNVASALLERALLQQRGNAAPPLAVLPQLNAIVPVGGARPLTLSRLTSFWEAIAPG